MCNSMNDVHNIICLFPPNPVSGEVIATASVLNPVMSRVCLLSTNQVAQLSSPHVHCYSGCLAFVCLSGFHDKAKMSEEVWTKTRWLRTSAYCWKWQVNLMAVKLPALFLWHSFSPLPCYWAHYFPLHLTHTYTLHPHPDSQVLQHKGI